MKAFDQTAISALRAGQLLVGKQFIIATRPVSELQGIWICGSDYMLEKLMGSIPHPLLQILDATDGKIEVEVEQSNDKRIRAIVDFHSEPGNLAMQLKQPYCLFKVSEINTASPQFENQKPLPLHPRFENALQRLISECKQRYCHFADGTFKLNRLQ